jgi:hypothetical protein
MLSVQGAEPLTALDLQRDRGRRVDCGQVKE